MGNCCSTCSKFRLLFRFRKRQHNVWMNNLCTKPECLPKPPTSDEIGGDFDIPMLTILRLDPLTSENGEAHNTSRYEIMNRKEGDSRLVVRRGQEFFLRIFLNRDYDPEIDGVSIVFTLDGIKKPNYGHGTFMVTPLLSPGEESEGAWHATLFAKETQAIVIKVSAPADAPIGKWKMEIDTKHKTSGGAISFNVNEPFYLLFNPWCQEDVVFIDDEAKRHEYVLLDTGLIWRGNKNTISASPWNFGQFERDILDCALYLLSDIGSVRASSRNDPVVISRVLTTAVNSNDDNGALMGNWSGDYSGGTSPTKWLGSVKILQEFYKTKKPVKYGQCWVFAGVLATVCKTLGLPSRVITNFSSAHDTQGSRTVDYFVDEKGNIMEELTTDSVWNFHVWSEVWMQRKDLGSDCDGWQAIDATPQEKSEGSFRCGPSSVAAIKNGEVMRPYDGGFLFAEVNADKVYWKYNGPTQPLKLVSKDTQGIGQYISTKAVGIWGREDLTQDYKYPETSNKEREAMLKALQQSESIFSRYYLNEQFNDIIFDFKLIDNVLVGDPFSVVLVMKNRSKENKYRVSVILRVDVVLYTGKVGGPVKTFETDRIIKPGSFEVVKLDVSWEEYGPRMLDQSAFNIACLANVKDTNFEYYAQDDFRVVKPIIDVDRQSEAVVDYPLEATASFINPLPIPLTNGKFLIQGPGLDTQLKIRVNKDILSGEKASCKFSMTPKFAGRSTIVAKFYSKELDDVDGFVNFMVLAVPVTNGYH
ncbi:LOW QUALITY PROTEIN: annulin-like [Cotesia glomerata]|uniref:LOW QUALITY PROTEIN: annulin-like n=1 Tax=Cotesia glomerata TaxID=32391 RepID=UPI001D02A422|nr:LOW QUALITY PROTEIN: annulin-like [Cotesia glomerata]